MCSEIDVDGAVHTGAPEMIGPGMFAKMLCVSRWHVEELQALGKLPEPIELLPGLYRWRRQDILGWIADGCSDQSGGR